MATTKKAAKASTTKKGSTSKKAGKSKKATQTKKLDKKELDSKNIKDTVKKTVESTREMKYNYPEDVVETTDRKSWRQKVRNKINSFELSIIKLDGKEKAKKEKEYKSYRKEVLLVP